MSTNPYRSSTSSFFDRWFRSYTSPRISTGFVSRNTSHCGTLILWIFIAMTFIFMNKYVFESMKQSFHTPLAPATAAWNTSSSSSSSSSTKTKSNQSQFKDNDVGVVEKNQRNKLKEIEGEKDLSLTSSSSSLLLNLTSSNLDKDKSSLQDITEQKSKQEGSIISSTKKESDSVKQAALDRDSNEKVTKKEKTNYDDDDDTLDELKRIQKWRESPTSLIEDDDEKDEDDDDDDDDDTKKVDDDDDDNYTQDDDLEDASDSSSPFVVIGGDQLNDPTTTSAIKRTTLKDIEINLSSYTNIPIEAPIPITADCGCE